MKEQSLSPNGPELSVVVPVLNEAENIEPLVGEIRSALDGRMDYEIVYVDDGSDDETPDILKRIAGSFPQFRFLRHRVRCGQSTAMLTGVRSARADWVATLDGDGQNDPADIPRLYERLLAHDKGVEKLLVVGYRRKRRDSWLRKFSSRGGQCGPLPFTQGRYPLTPEADSSCSAGIYFCKCPTSTICIAFWPALVIRHGGQVVSVEVNHRERTHGDSKYGLNKPPLGGYRGYVGASCGCSDGRRCPILK